jgi:hypothetical protein
LVESPGTAPGSDPRIASAFMSIVPKDFHSIGLPSADLKTLSFNEAKMLARSDFPAGESHSKFSCKT